MNNNLVKHRSEILFLYDVMDANPNGDPNDENKPRIDEETGINIVTDVRLKRTIRDYLYNFKNKEIFVRKIADEEGYIQDAKMRARDFLSKEFLQDVEKKDFNEQKKEIAKNILGQCIDVRLFGATIPLDLKVEKKSVKGSITLTGPVQFKIGRSLHPVVIKHIKGTGAFASGEKKRQATFRDEYVVHYSLIAFHGIINENAAQHSTMAEDDKKMLLEGLWMGTGNLISRSKFGQMPRLLMVVDYKDKNFFIGDLNNKIRMANRIPIEQVRGTSDYKLDISALVESLKMHHGKIERIQYKTDPALGLQINENEMEIKEIFSDIPVTEITF